ncbi:MAG TPA: ABC-F family ATP-binding cassette domain-containing protein [Bacteroidales bacterium]|nr:ABC-F family ATP-binding cassette domain-containing protein [Bacteroidales bacterium]
MDTILQVDNISKSIGSLQLFADVSFVINEGEKFAIIAKNGTGKTTLLNIVAGIDSADSGEIFINKNIKTAYLRQEPELNNENTVFEEVFHSSDQVIRAISAYEKAMESGDKKNLDKAITRMDHLNAWDHELRVRQILSKLQITDLDQETGTLSGGQKKRVALAQVLISDPEFLILDEPTNHLDIDMIEWLEEYLQRAGCTLLMVTHDRYFLSRICNEILEIDNGRLHGYHGNYSWFLEKRAERIENEKATVDKARNLLRKETDWMRRMPKARGTKAKYRVDAYYDLKKQASGAAQDSDMKIKIRASRMGRKIIESKNLSFSWDGTYYIRDFSYSFSRFEKIGVIGKNGTGKSTLLDLLTGKLQPEQGSLEYGETLVFGYMRQEGLRFDENQKVIDVARSIAETVRLDKNNVVDVSQFLTHFLFPPAVQHHHVSRLSGGEKRRLYLLTILMKSPNFLILDEPTNDLDIMSLAVLEDYLQNFPGCVMIVSHDRFFMDQIVDHLFIFEGDGIIRDFPGNYSQYRQHHERTVQAKKSQKKTQIITEKTRQPKPDASRKLTFKEKQEYELLEKVIEALEAEKAVLEKLLSSGNLSHEELKNHSIRIGQIINEIDKKTDRWLELGERT